MTRMRLFFDICSPLFDVIKIYILFWLNIFIVFDDFKMQVRTSGSDLGCGAAIGSTRMARMMNKITEKNNCIFFLLPPCFILDILVSKSFFELLNFDARNSIKFAEYRTRLLKVPEDHRSLSFSIIMLLCAND